MSDSVSTVSSSAELVSALRRSHERLTAAVTPLSAEQLTEGSYCSEWSIAQVMSHLGSGAEIFSQFLTAGLGDGPVPGLEEFKPIWDRWNAKTPEQQARDGQRVDAEFLDQLDALTDQQRSDWRMELFGTEQDLGGVVRLRLGEHCLHTWDIVVALEPDATLEADAAAAVIDGLGGIVARVGKPADSPLRVVVTTEAPQRSFLLELDPDGARLSSAAPEDDGDRGSDAAQRLPAEATLRLPAEAFIRLVYGRLDTDHTPAIEAKSLDLELLRRAFPGV